MMNLRDGPPLLGTLLTVPAPEVAEALALAGVDWLFLDGEHAPGLDPAAAQHILQAVAGRCPVLVRVPANDPAWTQRVLDAGADGVIVPHVRSVADARRAVRDARYPPLGGRGVGIARAQGYGADLAGYLARANDSTVLVAQIEDAEALDALDDILRVPGLDAVLAGPYDLSGSLGRLGDVGHPEVLAAVEHVRARCRAAGVPFGAFAGTVDAARAELAAGARFVAVGTDLGLLTGAAREVLAALR
ncbi:MAG TPA: aldolase/citrate lyase family protein [Pseudonocardiaceae bacterium]